jgi:hypothetical protein
MHVLILLIFYMVKTGELIILTPFINSYTRIIFFQN